MNKKISFIIVIIILGVGFLCTNSAQAIKFADKEIFVDFDGLPFDLSNFAPGMNTSTKTITITNNENFDIDVYFKAEKTAGDPSNYLADSLFVDIDNESNYLSDLLNTNITLGSIGSNASQSYDIFINFDKNAGNNSQNETIDFDFILTVEEEHQDEDEDDDENGDIPPIIIPGGGSSGTAAFCGDGDIDEFKGEECDDGNNIDGDGCSSNCKKEGEVKGESTQGEEETGEEGEGTDTGTGSSDTLGQGKEKGKVAGAETKGSSLDKESKEENGKKDSEESKKEDEEESRKNPFLAFIINLITFSLDNIWIILLLLIILAIIIYYFKRKSNKK